MLQRLRGLNQLRLGFFDLEYEIFFLALFFNDSREFSQEEQTHAAEVAVEYELEDGEQSSELGNYISFRHNSLEGLRFLSTELNGELQYRVVDLRRV